MKWVLGICLLSLLAVGAPYPVTSSSLFISSKKNFFLRPLQIPLNLEFSDYSIDLTQTDSEKWTLRNHRRPVLITMRYRRFQTDVEYEKSLRNWVKEYQKSGLQLIEKQIGENRPKSGWIHMQDTNEQQILQSFTYLSPDKIWVFFNCIGKKAELKILFQDCQNLNSRLLPINPLGKSIQDLNQSEK